MSFKNMPMIGKIMVLLAALGLVSIGAVVFASSKMKSIDDRYSDIIANPEKGILALSRANQKLIEVMSSIYTNAASTTDEANAAAVRERDAATAQFTEYMKAAKARIRKRLTTLRR